MIEFGRIPSGLENSCIGFRLKQKLGKSEHYNLVEKMQELYRAVVCNAVHADVVSVKNSASNA